MERIAEFSIGGGGRVGSARSGPACRSVRPSRPSASAAGATPVHWGRLAAIRSTARWFASDIGTHSMATYGSRFSVRPGERERLAQWF